MASIKCPQCGAFVSEKAVACNICAYPAKNFLPIHCATIKFLDVARDGIERNCYIFDKNYRKLAASKLGSNATFICCQPTEVLIQVAGCMCKPSITVSAGKKYAIRLIRFGLVAVEEVK